MAKLSQEGKFQHEEHRKQIAGTDSTSAPANGTPFVDTNRCIRAGHEFMTEQDLPVMNPERIGASTFAMTATHIWR